MLKTKKTIKEIKCSGTYDSPCIIECFPSFLNYLLTECFHLIDKYFTVLDNKYAQIRIAQLLMILITL